MARLCRAGGDWRAEIDAAWPQRDRRSDGWLGDQAHAQRRSDHNPDSRGVVRAVDIDVDGVPMPRLVELFRARGAGGDRRLRGGYVIFDGRIAGTHTGWRWHRYTGANPHTSHAHFSFGDAPADYDWRAPWGVAALQPPAHSHHTPTLSIHTHRGVRSGAYLDARDHINAWRKNRGYSLVTSDTFNEHFLIAVRTFQRAYGREPDGIVGQDTWRLIHHITKGAKA